MRASGVAGWQVAGAPPPQERNPLFFFRSTKLHKHTCQPRPYIIPRHFRPLASYACVL